MDQPRARHLPISRYLVLSGSLCLVCVYASAAGDPGKVRPKEASLPWFNSSPALPEDHEMLLYACMTLIAHRGRLAALKSWSPEALAEEKAFSSAKASGDHDFRAASRPRWAIKVMQAYKSISWSSGSAGEELNQGREASLGLTLPGSPAADAYTHTRQSEPDNTR